MGTGTTGGPERQGAIEDATTERLPAATRPLGPARVWSFWRMTGDQHTFWRHFAIGLAAILLTVSGLVAMLSAMPGVFGRGSAAPTARRATTTPTPTDPPTVPASATAPIMPTIPVPTHVGAYPTFPPGSASLGCAVPPSAGAYAINGGGIPGQPTPNEVALTFDDGPTWDSTPKVLDVLEQTHTPATFFVVGQHIQQNPSLIQREWNDGFAIGYHTFDHADMPAVSQATRAWEFTATIQAAHGALGNNACIWFWRPPYGDYNAPVLQEAATLGLTTIKWDVDSADWTQPGSQNITDRVLRNIHPGAIVLMHDGPAGRWQTVQALPAIIAGLQARGLTPVTLPKLLADARGIIQPTPTPSPAPTATPTETSTPTGSPTATTIAATATPTTTP